MRKHWKIVSLILLSPLVLVVLGLSFEHFRGALAVEAYKADLARKGETLEISKLLAKPIATANDGLEEVLRLQSSLSNSHVISGVFPPKMKLLAPGRALIGFLAESWNEGKATNSWSAVAADLESNANVLAELRLVTQKTNFNSIIDYSNGFDAPLGHLMKIKTLSHWFGTACQYSLRQAQSERALEQLIAAISTVRLIENDRLAISELVRIVISGTSFRTTWEALQTNQWTDQQLVRLQKTWEANSFITNMIQSLEVERAVGDTYFERFRKSNEEAYKVLFPIWPTDPGLGEADADSDSWWQGEFFRKQIYCRIWRFAWMRQAEKYELEGLQGLIRNNSSGAEKAANAPSPNWLGLAEAPELNFYDRWRFGATAKSLASLSLATLKAARAETEKSLVLCAIALKRYELRHGDPAPTLTALIPEFLASVPIDYMDNQAIRYELNRDKKWLLYSVGDNGIDDHGDASPSESGQRSAFIWKGKDFVWPTPASLEEVAAWQSRPANRE